jgi:hypothetical protein
MVRVFLELISLNGGWAVVQVAVVEVMVQGLALVAFQVMDHHIHTAVRALEEAEIQAALVLREGMMVMVNMLVMVGLVVMLVTLELAGAQDMLLGVAVLMAVLVAVLLVLTEVQVQLEVQGLQVLQVQQVQLEIVDQLDQQVL